MKIAFVYHQHDPHPSHAFFARTIGADFFSYNPRDLPPYITPVSSAFRWRHLLNYDIIFMESAGCLPMISWLKKFKPEKIVIAIAMDPLYHPVFNGMTNLKRRYLLKMLKHVDGFIAVSHMTEDLVHRCIDRPVRVVYPPIFNLPKAKSNLRNNNLLFIGHDRKTKGYDRLVMALPLIMNKFRNTRLYLIGTCCNDFTQKIEGLSIEGRVPDLDPYFKKCTFYVHPSDFDPCPVSVFDAMYAGMIPVLTRGVGQHELLLDGLDELVLESNDPSAISEKMLYLFRKPLSWRKRISLKCQKIAKQATFKKTETLFPKEFFSLVDEIKMSKNTLN